MKCLPLLVFTFVITFTNAYNACVACIDPKFYEFEDLLRNTSSRRQYLLPNRVARYYNCGFRVFISSPGTHHDLNYVWGDLKFTDVISDYLFLNFTYTNSSTTDDFLPKGEMLDNVPLAYRPLRAVVFLGILLSTVATILALCHICSKKARIRAIPPPTPRHVYVRTSRNIRIV
ncbi:unnamed protein product [Caenorhabditis bovis]|uniref:CUB domain-containing protein n=1 Tax=Caenorhabditis bovis TaxID=2654633 RepID=A0A8S1EJ80_9PELO|nr:unnamed protein product [Caenorhabditis bovis]